MKIERIYRAALERAGLELRGSAPTSGGHLKLLVGRPGESLTASVFCPATPSDFRNLQNTIRDAKRALREQEGRWDGGNRH